MMGSVEVDMVRSGRWTAVSALFARCMNVDHKRYKGSWDDCLYSETRRMPALKHRRGMGHDEQETYSHLHITYHVITSI